MRVDKLHRLGRLRTIIDYLATSLWLVPTVMTGLALVLAAAGREVDLSLPATGGIRSWIYTGGSTEARYLLGTLLSSMINMTSLVFSVTMVVLTLAASQFGPRLIRNFMASPQTQFVLGTFVMTIVYCVAVMAMIGEAQNEKPQSFFTVSLALFLVVLSLVLLIVFIHSLARSIVSETVIDRVGREMEKAIGRLESLDADAPEPKQALPAGFEQCSFHFGPLRAGYVQAIEFDQLVELADAHDVVIGFYFQPGDYVARGGRAIAVFPSGRISDQLREEIARAVTLGSHRTPVQDPEFSIRHLVEIAVRALSPGTNDPYTAVAVLHRLSAAMCQLMGRALPKAVFSNEHGLPRVVCPRPTYAGILSEGFDQIRQNGADKPLVLIHLFESLTRIAEHAELPEQLNAISAIADDVIADAERLIKSPRDLAAVRRRFEKTQRILTSEKRLHHLQ